MKSWTILCKPTADKMATMTSQVPSRAIFHLQTNPLEELVKRRLNFCKISLPSKTWGSNLYQGGLCFFSTYDPGINVTRNSFYNAVRREIFRLNRSRLKKTVWLGLSVCKKIAKEMKFLDKFSTSHNNIGNQKSAKRRVPCACAEPYHFLAK